MSRRMTRAGVVALALLLVAACGSQVRSPVSEASTSATVATTTTSARPAATTTSTAAPTTTAPSTTTTTRPTGPLHKVVIFGDSIMFVTSKYQEQRLRAAGIEVVNQSFPGTSVLGHTNVEQTFSKVVQDEHPDVVLAEYSGVYLPPYPKGPDGQDIAIRTPAWWDAWKAAVVQATRDLGSQGARVYWVLLPHDRITWANGDTRMNDLYTAVSHELPNVGLVDWRWAVSGPFGSPVDQLPIGANGALAPVRGSDGFHFSEEASNVLAATTVATLLKDYGIPCPTAACGTP